MQMLLLGLLFGVLLGGYFNQIPRDIYLIFNIYIFLDRMNSGALEFPKIIFVPVISDQANVDT